MLPNTRKLVHLTKLYSFLYPVLILLCFTFLFSQFLVIFQVTRKKIICSFITSFPLVFSNLSSIFLAPIVILILCFVFFFHLPFHFSFHFSFFTLFLLFFASPFSWKYFDWFFFRYQKKIIFSFLTSFFFVFNT
jgi:hypothetical protein